MPTVQIRQPNGLIIRLQSSTTSCKKPVEAVPVQRIVTKLEYLRRFTMEERITIRQAATQSPGLSDYLAMLELAQDINLDDADTIGAVSMLEGAGLIATGRAAEIYG